MSAQNTASSVDSELLLTTCKATAEALRLDILRVLSVESFGVMELCHIFDTAQPGMSHHLKILSSSGLLQTRREGNSIFYRRAAVSSENPISGLITSLFQSIDRIVLPQDISKRCQQIHRERAQNSMAFFKKNAARLKQNQDLIAQFSQYESCITDLLAKACPSNPKTVIEVGPGESDLIGFLSKRFGSLLAVDNADEMLNRTRDKVELLGLKNVEFFSGELSDLEAPHGADMIVLNMVLHHLPSPAGVFKSAHRILEPQGQLLIVDLCSHNQDWARDTCGDLWLGFDPNDLDQWAEDAKLEKGQGAYLGLRNGFQVQVRLYQQTSN
ncbi:MAG: ArsR family transcriptional regulator [Gammaproteobacteria bacterium]|jgi:ArsR family transcriptional regulator|nr:ArsR family transcriptional regulator [Gammaproteobacteria bacterium]|tara:strand:- start:3039 stop:4019 length:981 start_codon:yes stop_codon:yes gene_type:complete